MGDQITLFVRDPHFFAVFPCILGLILSFRSTFLSEVKMNEIVVEGSCNRLILETIQMCCCLIDLNRLQMVANGHSF